MMILAEYFAEFTGDFGPSKCLVSDLSAEVGLVVKKWILGDAEGLKVQVYQVRASTSSSRLTILETWNPRFLGPWF